MTQNNETPARRQRHGQRPSAADLKWDETANTGAALPADLQQLKALALAATPGPWMRLFGERTVYDRMEDGCRGNTIVRADTSYGAQDAANLDYIAAANPAVVLDLIARIERATAPHGSAAPTEATLTDAQIAAGAAVLDDDGRPVGRNTAIMVFDAMRDAGARAAAPTDAPCLHDFHYFGDQLDERRCAKCDKLESRCDDEPAPQRAAAPVSNKEKVDAHTTSYSQGYRAGIEMGKAMAADERAAAPVSGGERTMWEAHMAGCNQGSTLPRNDLPAGYRAAHRDGWMARAAVSASQAAPVGGELPPLPEPDHSLDSGTLPFFTADQMCAYARAAVAAAKVPTVEPVAWIVYALYEGNMIPQYPAYGDRQAAQDHAAMFNSACKPEVRPLFAAPVEQDQGAAPSEKAAASAGGLDLGGDLIELTQHLAEWGPKMCRASNNYKTCVHCGGFEAMVGMKHRLYRAQQTILQQVYPAPVGAGVVPEGWRETLKALIDHIDRNTCTHEETHRGGAIWTICDACGEKWADDEGGFKQYVEPEYLAEARDLLASAATAHPVAADDQVLKKVEDALIMAWSYVNDGGGPVADIDEACAEIRALKRTTAHGGAEGEQRD